MAADLPPEQPRRDMIALLRAASVVRGGRWIHGAPTHILAELLNELKSDGWVLQRETLTPAHVQHEPRRVGSMNTVQVEMPAYQVRSLLLAVRRAARESAGTYAGMMELIAASLEGALEACGEMRPAQTASALWHAGPRMCACGHTEHWHGDQPGRPGSGSCEYGAWLCDCQAFSAAAPTQLTTTEGTHG